MLFCFAGLTAAFGLPVTVLNLLGRSGVAYGPAMLGFGVGLMALSGFGAAALQLLAEIRGELRLLQVAGPDEAEPLASIAPTPAPSTPISLAPVHPAPARTEPAAAEAAPEPHSVPMPGRALDVSTVGSEGHQVEWTIEPSALHGERRGTAFLPTAVVGRSVDDGAPVEFEVRSITWIGPKGGRQSNDVAAFLRVQAGMDAAGQG